jgi:O-antigen/teichoic acid export membrane protein
VIGKSKEIFWAGFIIIVSSWVGALMLINIFGFVGIAMDYFFSNIFFCISYILIFKKSDYVFPIMSIILPKLFVALFSLLLILFMNVVFSKTLPILIVKLMVAFILYLVLMFAFVKQDSKELFNLIYERLNFKK